MTVAMQPPFQGRNCRMPGKCKDLIMDIATEEMGHVEMIATMVARLLEGAPATATTKAAGRVIARCLRFRRHCCSILIFLLSSSGLGVTD
jgi:Mn-containing catalase